MTKLIFGIFAHPDDEAFGPSGTLLQETRSGSELHLVTLTLGGAGTNPDNVPNLAKVREKEWHQAGLLIGATSMHHLGFEDGHLDNLAMIEASQILLKLVQRTIRDRPDIHEVEFITMDLNGISGHIDHIVAARTASWVFYQLKNHDSRLTSIRYACLPYDQLPEPNTNWIFMEAGRQKSEVNQVVDTTDLRDDIIEIMRCHHSQRADCEAHIENRGASLGISHFIVRS